MKKYIAFILALIMLASTGCSKQPVETAPPVPETTAPIITEAPTEAPTEPVPTCINAEVQVNDAPAIIRMLNRGDLVEVVGEYDENYTVVLVDEIYGLVENQLLRLKTADPYESWTGYAHYNAAIYSNYCLQGEPVQTLALNETVEILDELDFCYVVQTETLTGFVAKDEISKHHITYSAPSNSGGSSGGQAGGQDGGDISLRYQIVSLSMIEQAGIATGQAEILADGTPLILGMFDRGDIAPVVAEEGFAPEWDGYYTLYLGGFYAYLPEQLALPEGEVSFAQWDGFCGYYAKLYDSYLMQGEGTPLYVNTTITVLWDGGSFYMISLADGSVGYVSSDQIGTSRYATGGGNNSSSSGGGGSTQEWSDPVL